MAALTHLLLVGALVVATAGIAIGDGSSGTAQTEAGRQAPAWADSFESGDFRRWSWAGQGQEELWGHVAVVEAASAGIPALDGEHAARFETTPDDIANDRIHAKVFRSFSVAQGVSERPYEDQSGTYGAWYYLPETYRVPHGTTVNAFQFKDNYRTQDGKQSDPLWWVNFGNAAYWSERGGPRGLRDDAPVAYINSWTGGHWDDASFAEVPLGRWFELRAEITHGEQIAFHLDGRPLGTGYASQQPVGTFHRSSINLIFGVGNYSGGANGPLYVDAVSYRP
ncbi:MAG: hypothetical protein WD399_06385 [Thermoleophilaceae bacterium]